jgi:hypothetical protein
VARDQIPRYGARVRCPDCDSLQALVPAALSSEPVTSEPVRVDVPAASDAARARLASASADPAATRAEARRVLELWLLEIQRTATAPLSLSTIFREHGEELAHLFGMWKASFPNDNATEIFRDQLIEALENLQGTRGE